MYQLDQTDERFHPCKWQCLVSLHNPSRFIARNVEGVSVVDAGEATIEISSYALAKGDRGDFKEIAKPQCRMAPSGKYLVPLI
jgi:hypothetical protein